MSRLKTLHAIKSISRHQPKLKLSIQITAFHSHLEFASLFYHFSESIMVVVEKDRWNGEKRWFFVHCFGNSLKFIIFIVQTMPTTTLPSPPPIYTMAIVVIVEINWFVYNIRWQTIKSRKHSIFDWLGPGREDTQTRMQHVVHSPLNWMIYAHHSRTASKPINTRFFPLFTFFVN